MMRIYMSRSRYDRLGCDYNVEVVRIRGYAVYVWWKECGGKKSIPRSKQVINE
jgi:hypothetical protein